MPLLLLLLAVAGCAAPGRELQRGSVVAPPPAPPVRPGHGAPVIGQPGQQSQGVPRSSHQRELPPSPQPGLWAGDEPQASRKSGPAPPELFGLLLPGIRVSEKQVEEGPARACVALWTHALSGTRLAEQVNALRPQAKRCMVAHMNHACVRVIEELDEIVKETGIVVLQARRHRVALRKSATDFVLAECGVARLPEAQQQLLARLTTRLDESLHESD